MQIPTAQLTSNGKSLKVGAEWDKNRTTIANYVCEKIHGMHPLPHRFQPEVYQKYDNQNYYGKISEPYLSKMFTLVRSEVWLCKSINTNPYQFYRVLNEMIGRVEIKEVEYEDSIVALSSINIGSGGGEIVTIRFTEIGIFYVHNHNRLREELKYKLIPSNPKTSFIVPEAGPEIKDMTYILNGNSVYRTLINHEGYDIRVGSAAVTDIGSSSATSRCRRHSGASEGFNIVFKLIINDEVSFYTRELIRSNYVYYSKKQSTVWLCDIEGSQTGEQFYRIVNKLDVLVQVRIIESFDGIDILQTVMDDGSTMIEITELKYIRKSRKNAVRYEGKISFMDHEVTSNVVDPYAVTKSIEETTIRVGLPLPLKHDRYFNLHDFDGEMLNNLEEITFDSTKENTIAFAVTTSQIGENGDIVDCRLVDHDSNLYPDFEILNNQNNEIDSMENFGDAEKYSQYMERDSYKIWLCENPEKKYKFYRTLSHQRVKSQPSHPLGKVRYTKHDKVIVEMEAQYVLKMEAIRYLDEIDYNRKAVKFGGSISFVETIPSKSWKSGSQGVKIFPGGDPRKRMKIEPSRKFNYNLERERKIYTLPKNSDGTQQGGTLEIGSKWQSIHPKNGIVE
ncbi:uncharacterized protein LOC111058616 isoform X1 [Nilaparvata lugens]|uniref:uncharacterized protein LOC111058616 isoform X1 n=1 Tax=Nilaparvata lugens TaxID=108931 RepID=UPI00193E5BAF|nr:uncharacterized protein LOC111058616 isoform X1 [Nilaparvata lugens]